VQSRRAAILIIGGALATTMLVGATSGSLVGPDDPSTPPSSSAPAAVASDPIVVSKDDVTIEGVAIRGSGAGSGIRAVGTAADPIDNLTIRDCFISGFEVGIEVRHVRNLVIERCTIDDSVYAGILVYSSQDGRISENTIRKVGFYTPLDTTYENNAYGIALTRLASPDYLTHPRTSDFIVEGNLIEDVPYWHCLDTHAGERITFTDNVTRRCPRAIFITTDGLATRPSDITVSANRLEQGLEVEGGTNLVAITLVNVQVGTVRDNEISTTYPQPFVQDYLGEDPAGSTDVSVSGSRAIP
jgi:parallel beta-helix repeat protein